MVTTTYGYDGIGRLNDLIHRHGATTINDYGWTFDAASRITAMTSGDGTSSFTYDSTDQLATAVHSYQDTEGYTYDDNGNRTNTGYVTGADNQVTSDGTYNYAYDNEGNCVRRTKISDGTTTRYVWDYRNRLVQVTEHPNATPSTPATRIIKYTYDAADQLVRRTLDTNADGTPETVAKYVYDGGDLALELNGSNALTHRYLWNSAVDEILADEKIGDQVIWPLADHEGTVRDLVSSSGAVLNHRKYDSFGKITAESDPTRDHLFAYTGQILDEATGLQNHLHRWYNPALGRWISEDPASFSAGDANLYRYCGNGPVNNTDPSGLSWLSEWWDEVEDGAKEIFGNIEKGFERLVQDVEQGFTDAWNGIRDNITGIAQTAIPIIAGLICPALTPLVGIAMRCDNIEDIARMGVPAIVGIICPELASLASIASQVDSIQDVATMGLPALAGMFSPTLGSMANTLMQGGGINDLAGFGVSTLAGMFSPTLASMANTLMQGGGIRTLAGPRTSDNTKPMFVVANRQAPAATRYLDYVVSSYERIDRLRNFRS